MMANIIIPDDEIRKLWNDRHHVDVNPLSLTAVQAAYTHGQKWLNELNEYLDQNFTTLEEFLIRHLPKAKFKIPQATYMAWIDLGAYFARTENLTKFFATKARVILQDENSFVENADGFIRLNLACPGSKLKKGLEKIAYAINNAESEVN